MKQSEKSKLTYEKILNAAILEFGTSSYESASINNICNDNNISKGLIYHHFKNKDELYLCCVEMCFQELICFLKAEKFDSTDLQKNLDKIMELRNRFFREKPYYSKIFFDVLLAPPSHLTTEVQQIKKIYDQFNLDQYKKMIEGVTLRDGISEEEALEYFFILGEMFNGYFGSKNCKTSDFNSLVNEHEMKLSKILNIILYGIVKGE